ncbi:MAG: ABC transporter permease [Lachnospiraceae bacterium]|nr:ABC transporter permease [Lachnospiraceae bacterium]
MNTKKKEPMFHIVKRAALPWYKAWAIRGIALLLSLVVCAFVTMLVTGDDPVAVFRTMFTGAFGTSRKTWVTLKELAILLCISLALTPAFKMRFWNIGGEGQVMMGCLAAAACMVKLGDALPAPVLILVMIIASLGAGMIWAMIPALCKAKWNTNETLFTLMMNYVATQIVAYFIIRWEVPKGSGKIGIINQQSHAGWLPTVFGNKYLLNVLIVLALTIFMYIYLTYTKQGYEIAVVGESERTARYVGIKVEKVIVRTLCLTGAICGLCGLLLVSGSEHTLTTTIAGGQGFTGVMVAWMAKFNPIGMVFTSLLLIFMSRGANEIATVFSLNEAFGDILTGIIIFFLIGSEFFVTYKLSRKKSA